MYPGINTYYIHYHDLYSSSKILLYVIKKRWSDKLNTNGQTDSTFEAFDKKLILPFILTMYSFLECMLSELEDRIDESKFNLPYSRSKRPEITERLVILHELLTGHKFDKSTSVFADYKYAIRIRNLMTHASGEEIKWSRMDIAPIGVKIGTNGYHYNKEDFIKCDFEQHIFRNAEADKIIRYLAGKKLVPEFWQGRCQGWLKYISFPSVAGWFFDSIINVITPTLLELAKSEENSIKQFALGAQRTLFDKEIEQMDYEKMLAGTVLNKKKKNLFIRIWNAIIKK